MPAVGQQRINVKGFRELNRAFGVADKSLKKEYRDALKDIGEPVASDAERRAQAAISRIGVPWSRMRVRVTTRLVYVAPAKRGTRDERRRRPRFGTRLMDEAMQPALQANIGESLHRFERMLDEVGRDWERA